LGAAFTGATFWVAGVTFEAATLLGAAFTAGSGTEGAFSVSLTGAGAGVPASSIVVPDTEAPSFDVTGAFFDVETSSTTASLLGTGASSTCFAAASISDEVITTRLAGSSAPVEAVPVVDFDTCPEATDGTGATGAVALAGAGAFLPDFPEVFCFETAIVSNLILAGADAPNSCCIAT